MVQQGCSRVRHYERLQKAFRSTSRKARRLYLIRLLRVMVLLQTTVTFHPAMVAAKKMEKKIHDQLQESGASVHLRSMAFEMALLGTGVMKGPFAVDKEYPNWNEEGEYEPLIKTVPECSHVSVWDFYPDPEAKSMEDAEYVVERHKMSRTQLRALKNVHTLWMMQSSMAVDKGPDYVQKHWELTMEDDDTQPTSERWEVLEFWGFVDTRLCLKNTALRFQKS